MLRGVTLTTEDQKNAKKDLGLIYIGVFPQHQYLVDTQEAIAE